MTLPRCVHRAWAALAGYFWMPCPICGRYFGGHECAWVGVTLPSGKCMTVCSDPECAYEAGVLQVMNGHKTFVRIESRFPEYVKEGE